MSCTEWRHWCHQDYRTSELCEYHNAKSMGTNECRRVKKKTWAFALDASCQQQQCLQSRHISRNEPLCFVQRMVTHYEKCGCKILVNNMARPGLGTIVDNYQFPLFCAILYYFVTNTHPTVSVIPIRNEKQLDKRAPELPTTTTNNNSTSCNNNTNDDDDSTLFHGLA
jgi:hypothetical protein